MPKSTKNRKEVIWRKAPDIGKRVRLLIVQSSPGWSKKGRIFCYRSKNSKAYAYARIWGLGRLWQEALKTKPTYIIEVISERFDRLGENEKDEVLLHELAHIPTNFSGSLVPHIRHGKRKFHDRVRRLILNKNLNRK